VLHFTLDGFGGHRSRYDDIRLVQELCEELPNALGLSPIMPPMLLPYYNGVEADDCGISAFVMLAGGHLTLHTFSVRECYFADLVTPEPLNPELAEKLFVQGLPADYVDAQMTHRTQSQRIAINPNRDFGPHLMIDIEGYQGPRDMDGLFELMDTLPERLNMTPIMRPYVLPSYTASGEKVLSAVTMIAESHVALHWFAQSNRAYFDVFSCKFFDADTVIDRLYAALPGMRHKHRLISRGVHYHTYRNERVSDHERSRKWLAFRVPSATEDIETTEDA